jgi:hypothetical protein
MISPLMFWVIALGRLLALGWVFRTTETPVATVASPVAGAMPPLSQTDCGSDHLEVCPVDDNELNAAQTLWGLAQQDERETCRDIRSPKEMVHCLSFLRDKRGS